MSIFNHKNRSHKLIADSFSPLVGILTSHGSDELCLRNNLTFLEMIRPFCECKERIRIDDRDSLLAVDMRDFRLSLIDLNIPKISQDVLAALVDEVVKNSSKIPPIDSILYDFYKESTTLMTWYEAYMELILNMIIPISSESFHKIFACILCVSTSEDVLQKLTELNVKLDNLIQSNSENCYVKFFQNNIYRLHILLHDPANISNDKFISDQKLLAGVFDDSFIPLIINTKTSTTTNEENNPWIIHKLFTPSSLFKDSINTGYAASPTNFAVTSEANSPAIIDQINDVGDSIFSCNINSSKSQQGIQQYSVDYSSPDYILRSFSSPYFFSTVTEYKLNDLMRDTVQGCGKYLNDTDIMSIKIMIKNFIINKFIPHLALTFKHISILVDKKKPLKSVFNNARNFLKTGSLSSKAQPIDSSFTMLSRYHPETYEGLLKKLADLSFIMRKFDHSSTLYHSLLKFTENDDGNLARKTSCQEMLLIISYLTEVNKSNSLPSFISIVRNYTNLKLSDYALRASFIFSQILIESDLFQDAAFILHENVLDIGNLKRAILYDRMGMLYEQGKAYKRSSHCYLMAGVNYNKLSHYYHSLRCYHLARKYVSLNALNSWAIAKDFMNQLLSKFCLDLGFILESAISVYNLLRDTNQDCHTQENHITLFITILNNLKQYPEYLDRFLKYTNISAAGGGVVIKFIYCDIAKTKIEFRDRAIFHSETNGTNYDIYPSKPICDCKYNVINENWHSCQKKIFSCLSYYSLVSMPPELPIIVYPDILSSTPASFEPFIIVIPVTNLLNININISNIILIWSFNCRKHSRIVDITDADSNRFITYSTIPSQYLEHGSTENICFVLEPKETGLLTISGIGFTLISERSSSTLESCTSLFSRQNPLTLSIKNYNIELKIYEKLLHLNANLEITSNNIYQDQHVPIVFNVSIKKDVTIKTAKYYFYYVSTKKLNLFPKINSSVKITDFDYQSRFGCEFQGKIFEIQLPSDLNQTPIGFTLNPLELGDCDVSFMFLFIYYNEITKEHQFTTAFLHQHINCLPLLNINSTISSLSISEIEEVFTLYNNIRMPPLKVTIVIDYSNFPFDSYSLQFLKIGFNLVEKYRVVLKYESQPICNPNQLDFYFIYCSEQSANTSFLDFNLNEHSEVDFEKTLNLFLKDSNFNNFNYLTVLFWNLSFIQNNTKYIFNGSSPLELNVPYIYNKPSSFSQIITNATTNILQFPYNLKVDLIYDGGLIHDFSKCYCVIPICLIIWNYSLSDFDIKVSVVSNSEISQSMNNSNELIWIGNLSYSCRFSSSKSNEPLKLKFFAVAIKSGCYDMSDIIFYIIHNKTQYEYRLSNKHTCLINNEIVVS